MSTKNKHYPRRPREPAPEECCGRGCDPCIYTYYERALKKWEEKVALIQQQQQKRE